jgi:hypothetical protein
MLGQDRLAFDGFEVIGSFCGVLEHHTSRPLENRTPEVKTWSIEQ